MLLPGFARYAWTGLLAVLLSAGALAQEDSIEAAITESQSSATIRELQAQAGAEVPKTDDKHELAIFHHKRGLANFLLGNYAQAAVDLRLALENVQPKRPTPDGWGRRTRIQNALGEAYEQQGNWFALIDLWSQIAQEYQQSDLFFYFRAQLKLMWGYYELRQWAESDRARREAETTLLRLPRSARWANEGFEVLRVNNYFAARIYRDQGDYREAELRFKASLEWAEKNLQLRRRAVEDGHPRLRDALISVGYSTRDLAIALSWQGKYGEAETYARAGLESALTLYGFNSTAVADGLYSIGLARFQQGDVAGAETYYRRALAAVERSAVVPNSVKLAGWRGVLANALLVQYRWNDALNLYEERDQGLRSEAAQFKRRGSDHVGWAYVLHKTGRSQRAADMAGRIVAYQSRVPVPDRWLVAQHRGVLGMALAATGKTADALKAYRESIPELIRRDQDDATVENTGYWRAFWQRVILESYLELLAMLHASGSVPADLHAIDESFWVADIARSSSVQEAIAATAARAQLPDGNLAELARKEQDALNRIVALNRTLARLASAPEQKRLYKILSDIRAEIERLRKEHAALRAEIRKRYPEYAELIDPKPAGIGDVRKILAPGEALVSIYLGESQAYVWTIAAGGKAAFRVVPVERAEIEREVRELRRAMDFGGGDSAQLRPFDLVRAHKLYRMFLEPEEALWKDARVLNVIPQGALGELPFALLVTAPSQQPAASAQAGYADVPWLARKVAIAQLPSASAFAALRRAPAGKAQRQPFIGFGDPLFTADSGAGDRAVRNLVVRKIADAADEWLSAAMRSDGSNARAAPSPAPTLSNAFSQLSALPDTSDELREIAAVLKSDPARNVFVGSRATEKNVKQASLENTRVVAFATHGIAPGELTGLDQPALALSNPALTGDSDNDGFLTMEEVLGLKLDADWVVLSACNTASADGRGSEAVSGLGRAFFYAGARSLLVSNWAVETSSARLLTTEVFKRQADNPQMTRAEALRQSMLSLMTKSATDAAGRATFSYAHPAFWAPFSLVGDGGSR